MSAVITHEEHEALAQALDAARDENEMLKSWVDRLSALVGPVEPAAPDLSTFNVTDYLVSQELIMQVLA